MILLTGLVAACGVSEHDEEIEREPEEKIDLEKKLQSDLEDWAAKRTEFIRKYCNDPEIDCQKLMEEAGLKAKTKDLL